MLLFLLLILLFVFIIRYVYIARWSIPVKKDELTLIFANKGTGKTTFLAKCAYDELFRLFKGKSDYVGIASNVPIKGCYRITRENVYKMDWSNWLILLDEGSIEYNNRKMNMKQEEIEFFKLQRHHEATILIVSQDYSDIDITLRRLYDNMYLMKGSLFSLLPGLDITRVKSITKTVGIDETTHQIIDAYNFTPFRNGIFNRRKYYHMFDSWAAPEKLKHEPNPWYSDFKFEDIRYSHVFMQRLKGRFKR